jgi:hypothetical protein
MQIQDADAYAARHVGAVHVALCSAACVAQFDVAPQRYMQLPDHSAPTRRFGGAPLLRPLTAGALVTFGLLIFYLGMITLAQGWAHAGAQLLDDRNFIAAIVLGFGTQVGLYTIDINEECVLSIHYFDHAGIEPDWRIQVIQSNVPARHPSSAASHTRNARRRGLPGVAAGSAARVIRGRPSGSCSRKV